MCHFQLGHTGDKSVCEDAASFCWPVVNASSISSPAGVGKKKNRHFCQHQCPRNGFKLSRKLWWQPGNEGKQRITQQRGVLLILRFCITAVATHAGRRGKGGKIEWEKVVELHTDGFASVRGESWCGNLVGGVLHVFLAVFHPPSEGSQTDTQSGGENRYYTYVRAFVCVCVFVSKTKSSWACSFKGQ